MKKFYVYTAKVQETKTTVNGENVTTKDLKKQAVMIPKNVVDSDDAREYFQYAMHYHMLTIQAEQVDADYYTLLDKKANDELTAKENEKFENVKDVKHRLAEKMQEFKNAVSSTYASYETATGVFASDNFARMYVLTLLGVTTTYTVDRKGEKVTITKTPVQVTGQRKIAKHVHSLTAEVLAKGKHSDEFYEFQTAVNDAFATNGGAYYKNVTPKYTISLVHDYLTTRSKNDFKTAKTGWTVNSNRDDYIIARNAFYMFLWTQGVLFEGNNPVEKTTIVKSADLQVIERKPAEVKPAETKSTSGKKSKK